MMKSMTGFGVSKAETDVFSISLEVKSVNGRYLNINAKLPRLEGSLEFENLISKSVKERFKRGSFDIYFSFNSNTQSQTRVAINQPVAEQYFTAIEGLKQQFSLPDPVTLSSLLQFNEIFQKESVSFSFTKEAELLEVMLNEALENLDAMRTTEGTELKKFFLRQLKNIEELVKDVEKYRKDKVDVVKEKLTERLQKLFSSISLDENRVIQEAAFLIDKSDIEEEITRLKLHIDHFRSFFDKEINGKKLEFLLQEMNREVNTIGSKGNDFGIAQTVAEMKSLLETIREQVLNIE